MTTKGKDLQETIDTIKEEVERVDQDVRKINRQPIKIIMALTAIIAIASGAITVFVKSIVDTSDTRMVSQMNAMESRLTLQMKETKGELKEIRDKSYDNSQQIAVVRDRIERAENISERRR